MQRFKASLVCTVINEESTIGKLIRSVFDQSVLPEELILVDGGSKDKTVNIIRQAIDIYKDRLKIKLIIKKGNRSIGRNEAIKYSSTKIILITDAGCVLDKNWIRNITIPFRDKKVDVVAGYYKGKAQNIFQKSLMPYVLVMEDKVDLNNFLPATRSMAIRKEVWEKLNGFDERLSHNEDYAFANKIKNSGFEINFQKSAIVYWIPRENFRQVFKMFFRFAFGDAQANIFRDKVVYIFLRYIFATYLFLLAFIMKSLYFNTFVLLCFFVYIAWSVWKNYKYVSSIKALYYLPLLQFLSDTAVITGTSIGLIQKINLIDLLKLTKRNKGLLLIILVYIATMLALIGWGIPNTSHPFNYAMDEWHFSQALRAFFTHGTGLISGAANIPFFHIISSIIFLVPFYLLGIVNPLAIRSSIDNLPMQQVVFEILRLHTLLYGVLSVLLIYGLLKKYIKELPIVYTAIFTFTPIWLLLTNYYKYDITLIFWIITTLYLLIKYYKSQNINHFIFAGIACGLALATKFTAAPLFLSYIITYFLFSEKKNYKYLLASCVVVLFIFLFVGIPDIVFGKGNYYELLYSTLIQGPKLSSQFHLGYPIWFYLVFKEFPSIFGYFITLIYYFSLLFYTVYFSIQILSRKIKEHKIELFLYLNALLFFLSTTSFNLDGGGNRALVLLPFMVLLPSLLAKKIFQMQRFMKYRKIIYALLIAGFILQVIQSYAWISVKKYQDPREVSSKWILEKVPKGSEIGIENIPIYQMLPDVVLKEFYFKQYNSNYRALYKYQVISLKTNLPKYVIVTNDFDNVKYITHSAKEDLVKKLNKTGYKRIMVFSPELKYYNIFADKLYFIVINIIQMPVTISIYEK